jgi:peptide/nickel transport system permease protein
MFNRAFFSDMLHNRSLMLGTLGFLAMVLVVVVTPWIVTTSPTDMDYARILLVPSSEALFGTDDLGRDLFSRVMYGGRTSMSIGLQVMVLTTMFGTVIGLLTGYFDRVDMILMRLMDITMSFPALLLAIALLAIMGHNPLGVVIALTVVYSPRTARVVRSVVLSLREEDYVSSALAVGCATPRILLLHILPGVVPALVVQETFLFAYAILGEAGLSFVGVGVQPPAPSWGNIMGDARVLIREAPWLMMFPGAAIMFAVLSLNLLGDGLRDALSPRRVQTGGRMEQPGGMGG